MKQRLLIIMFFIALVVAGGVLILPRVLTGMAPPQGMVTDPDPLMPRRFF
jgi:hypothetical protein